MAIAVLARVGKLARKRHQLGDIRGAKAAIPKLQLSRNRITDTNAVIGCVTHGRPPPEKNLE
jgi:hypothetical protein